MKIRSTQNCFGFFYVNFFRHFNFRFSEKIKKQTVMDTNTQNLYLFKAIEAYPWELEKAVEALNYALAYEPENPKTWCLMAKVYSEQLGDNEKAKSCFETALAARMDIPEVYPDYIRLLINNEDFEMAQKLIDFTFTVKGIDKASIYLNQANLYEAKMDFANAEEMLEEAKLHALNNSFIEFIEEELSRVIKKKEFVFNKKNKTAETAKKAEVSTTTGNWLKNRLNNLI